MSKILNVGDLHFGVKKDDPWMQGIQRSAIMDMIEYSKDADIEVWIQYGDVFDNRQALTHETISFANEMFELIREAGITVYIIVGNHDAPHKNTLHNHAVGLELGHFDNLRIYDRPTTVDFYGIDIDLIPWMCADNTGEILDFISKSSSSYCIGHWELTGFWFYKGLKSHGISADFLSKYEQVWSGHFHTISESGNVKYIGTPYTITAGDENDIRGVWEFDTETREMSLIENENIWHVSYHYPSDVIDPKKLKNKAVRIFVSESDNALVKLESKLEEVVHSLKVITDGTTFSGVETGNVEGDFTTVSISSLGHKFIDSKEDISEDEKKGLKSLFDKLYLEARSE